VRLVWVAIQAMVWVSAPMAVSQSWPVPGTTIKGIVEGDVPDLSAVQAGLESGGDVAGLPRDDALQDFGVFETVVDLSGGGQRRDQHGDQQHCYPGGEDGPPRRRGQQRLGPLSDV
jgi:hypothetical protein